jgi:alpha-tubulin suppressor-like RCC1 family protein
MSNFNSFLIYSLSSNYRGQLGLSDNSESVIHFPQYFFSTMQNGQKVADLICGSESTHVVDEGGKILLGCGWNEHGNLGMSSCDENVYQLTAATGARLVKPPYSEQDESDGTCLIAARGGAHFLAMLK